MNGYVGDLGLSASVEDAVNFLLRWPTTLIVLSAIDPNKTGVIETRTFTKDQPEEIAAWISSWSGERNIYFSVNQVRKPLSRKATKDDIAFIVAFHTDIDCKADPNHIEAWDAALQTILDKAESYSKPPPIRIFSGGGYQFFWPLTKPFAIENAADIENIESRNRKIATDLAGDNCHNVDRIMRVPFTINVPTKKKRDKGRKRELAGTVGEPEWDLTYSIVDFAPLENRKPKGQDEKARPEPWPCGDLPEWAERVIANGPDAEGEDHSYGGDRSKAVWAVACAMVRAGRTDDEIVQTIVNPSNAISAHVLAQGNPQRYARRQAAKAREEVGAPPLLLSPASPLASARLFLTRPRARRLIHHASSFYEWQGTHYAPASDDDIASRLYEFMERADRLYIKGKTVTRGPYNPKPGDIENVRHALRGVVHIRDAITPPSWLIADQAAEPLMACANGLLRLSDGALLPHSADYFNTSAADFGYDPEADEPAQWLEFLASVWPDDQTSIDTAQEIAGYLISGDLRQQKMFLLEGPKRSGKGTFGRVLRNLVGRSGCAGPTLTSIARNFGLEPLLNKSLAIIPDARIHGGASEVVERLLAISGGDELTIDRKNKSAWTGALPTRILFLTNEVPAFADNSGAIASRFITLRMENSFYGREDLMLGDKLDREMPGILNWAIAGWRRLQERGHFLQPESGRATADMLDELASPIKSFIRDRCEVGPGYSVTKGDLFRSWCDWCEGHGRKVPGTIEQFGRNLLAAGGFRASQPRADDGKRLSAYAGLRFRRDDDGAAWGSGLRS